MPYRLDPKTGQKIYANINQAPAQQTQQTNMSQQPQQNPGILSSVGGAIIKPAVNYAEHVGEGLGQGIRYLLNAAEYNDISRKLADGTATDAESRRFEELNAPIFMSQEKLNKYSTPGGAAEQTIRKTAGGASYFVPGGAGVKGAVAAGAATGALSTLSEDNTNLNDIAGGAVAGGAMGGAFGILEKGISNKLAQKAGQKLVNAGEDIQIASYVKSVGAKPIAREGGNNLLTRMKSVGIKPGSAEQVLEQANQIIMDESPKILEAAQSLSSKGVKISVKDITDVLKKQIGEAKSTITKKPLQEVLDVIATDLKGKKFITPEELYLLKTEYGSLGKWSSLSTAVEKKQAEAWRDVYIKANDILDKALTDNGFTEFRTINEAVHTAMQAHQYASRVANVAPNKNTIGLMDVIYGTTGAAAGGPMGVIGSLLLRKGLESPQAAGATAGIVKTAGKALSEIPGMSANVPQAARNALITGVNNLPDNGQNIETQSSQGPSNKSLQHDASIPQQPSPKKSAPVKYTPDVFYEAMILARANGDVDSYKALKDMYDVAVAEEKRTSEKPKSKTEAEVARDDLSFLVEDAVAMLDTNPKIGIVAGPLEDIKAKVGLGDPATVDFNIALANIKASLAKARAGTSFTPNEEKLLERYSPTVGDSKQQIVAKLNGLQRLLNKKSN